MNEYLAGINPVLEYLRNKPNSIDKLFIQQDKRNTSLNKIISICRMTRVKFQFVPRQKLDILYPSKHQGVLARISLVSFQDSEILIKNIEKSKIPLLVVLDQIKDPGNAGTIARTAYALGVAGLVISQDRTAYLGSAALNASAGALSRLPVARVVNVSRFLRECSAAGIQNYYAGLDESCSNLYTLEVHWPMTLVLGSEEKGIRPGVAKECLAGLQIPMSSEFDSLNVAQAGGIILGELYRKLYEESPRNK